MTEPSTSSSTASTSHSSPADHGVAELKSAVVAGAHDVKDGLAHITHDVVEQTKKGTASSLTSGKARAADGLRDVAKALRTASEQLHVDENEILTGYIETAATKVGDASKYLKDHSLSELSSDMKSFARREPALFLGGALVLGLVGGRFLKSASPEAPPRTGGMSPPPSPQPRLIQGVTAPMRASRPSAPASNHSQPPRPSFPTSSRAERASKPADQGGTKSGSGVA